MKILLFFIVVVLGVYVVVALELAGSPSSHFNQTTRFELGKYSILRSIFGLHNDGDARGWYFSAHNGITVQVVTAQSASISSKVVQDFTDDIKTYTGNQVNVIYSYPFSDKTLSQSDIADIVKTRRSYFFGSNPDIVIVYAQDYQRPDGEVGKTYQEYGMVLSDKRLREVTANYSAGLDQFVESTLLHELGHQLGLEHNDRLGCVMTASAEKPTWAQQAAGDYTPTKFCEFELNQLKQIEQQFN